MRNFAIVATLAVVLSAAYLLWTVKRVAYGPPNPDCAAYPDCTRRELAALLPLAACLIVFGVWPAPLLDAVRPACESLVGHVLWAAGQVAP